METTLTADAVTTICANCQNYIWMSVSFNEKHCTKAAALSRDPVSGWYTFQTNHQKNQGNCADFVQLVPVQRDPAPAPPRVIARSFTERIRLAKELISTGSIE